MRHSNNIFRHLQDGKFNNSINTAYSMRKVFSLAVGSRDELPCWFLLDGDCLFVQIGVDSTILCVAQTPELSSVLIDHASPVTLHMKIIAQRLSKLCPGKQIFVSTDRVEEENDLFWESISKQLNQTILKEMNSTDLTV